MARSTIVTILLGVIAAAAVMVALGGCSGAGSGTPTVSGASVKTLATGDVTAARELKVWLTLLYLGEGGGTGIHASVRPKQTTAAGTNTDGSTYSYYFDDNDLSGHSLYVWTDGSWRYVKWSPWLAEPNGIDVRINYVEWWGDPGMPVPTPTLSAPPDHNPEEGPPARFGTKMTYAWYSVTTDYSLHTEGRAQMVAGGAVQFSIVRLVGSDALSVSFSDGTAMTLATHTRVITNVTVYALDFGAGATGTIAGPGGTQAFVLEGVNTSSSSGSWTRMDVTSADGTKAQFELGAGFAGSGQIALAGQLLGSLNWDNGANGVLRQVGTDAIAVAPTDVARRFAIDRFIYSASAMSAGATW